MRLQHELATELTQHLKEVAARLAEALALEKSAITRDAAIKRFEFTLDLAWKTIKLWLENQRGVICKSSKTCIREAYTQHLIEYNEQWIKMIDDRNAIAHMYKEKWADGLYERLPDYLRLIQDLLTKLKEQ